MSGSTDQQEFRLLIDPPAGGVWNMALDEALLDSAAEGGPPTLRFYRWSEPTLSLGYFQHYAERQSHAASRDCAVVRRLSGGGAILHDREITYSLALPLAHPLAADAAELYQTVHAAVIQALETYSLRATRHVADVVSKSGEQPFLCFQRRAAGDVICQGAKICGSAQRRRRGGILQHGSLLFAQSSYAPELPGINNFLDTSIAIEQFIDLWQEILAKELQSRFLLGEPSTAERASAEAHASNRFADVSWTRKR